MILNIQRGDGEKNGPIIENKLATKEGVLRELGRNYLDEKGFDKNIIRIIVPFSPDMPLKLGEIVEVKFDRFNEIKKCKIIGINIKIEKNDLYCLYTLEEPIIK